MIKKYPAVILSRAVFPGRSELNLLPNFSIVVLVNTDPFYSLLNSA